MTPLEMLDIRNKIENALKPLGWKGTGAGVGLCGEPSADIDGDLDGKQLWIKIRVKNDVYADLPETEAA